jgi:hypothetical protein
MGGVGRFRTGAGRPQDPAYAVRSTSDCASPNGLAFRSDRTQKGAEFVRPVEPVFERLAHPVP